MISTPLFRQTIVDTSQFEHDSAALSKRLVFDMPRTHALTDDNIEIELTAASAADCRAAYCAIADRIEQRHNVLFDQNAKVLQAAIDDYRERSIQLKKWEDGDLQLGSQSSAGKDSKSGLGIAWNDTKERLRRLEAVKLLVTRTMFPAESEVYMNGPLSHNTVRLSALAGLAVVLSSLLLLLGLELRRSTARKPEI
ncbi:hypothetical protein [Bradyrhizobium sp. dw_78]|uniref:hypothetical protein n=1 Tax=Bradyrhizobium sp. dw_78 TaxID=2719793 RepID=UPI001BD42430|nr:hypothetical protein [Bradyrhizobium sp. dw_78]